LQSLKVNPGPFLDLNQYGAKKPPASDYLLLLISASGIPFARFRAGRAPCNHPDRNKLVG
jgi:hypothetical protein